MKKKSHPFCNCPCALIFFLQPFIENKVAGFLRKAQYVGRHLGGESFLHLSNLLYRMIEENRGNYPPTVRFLPLYFSEAEGFKQLHFQNCHSEFGVRSDTRAERVVPRLRARFPFALDSHI